MLTELRDAVTSYANTEHLASAFSSIPVAYDNQPFDWTNLPDQYATFSVVVYSTDQVTMAFTNPRKRAQGAIKVTVHTRVGKGCRGALAMLDWYISKLEYRRIGGAQVKTASAIPPTGSQDWYQEHLVVPLYLDA